MGSVKRFTERRIGVKYAIGIVALANPNLAAGRRLERDQAPMLVAACDGSLTADALPSRRSLSRRGTCWIDSRAKGRGSSVASSREDHHCWCDDQGGPQFHDSLPTVHWRKCRIAFLCSGHINSNFESFKAPPYPGEGAGFSRVGFHGADVKDRSRMRARRKPDAGAMGRSKPRCFVWGRQHRRKLEGGIRSRLVPGAGSL